MPLINDAQPIPVPEQDPFNPIDGVIHSLNKKYGIKVKPPAPKFTPTENPDPVYAPGQIVYLVPNPTRNPSEHNPFIGSPYEIDCKILYSYKNNGETAYHVVSGIGATFEIKHDFLTLPKNKSKYKTNEFFTLNEDIGICNAGINFNRVGEYYSNDYHGIFIHHSRFEQILYLFTKHLVNE